MDAEMHFRIFHSNSNSFNSNNNAAPRSWGKGWNWNEDGQKGAPEKSMGKYSYITLYIVRIPFAPFVKIFKICPRALKPLCARQPTNGRTLDRSCVSEKSLAIFSRWMRIITEFYEYLNNSQSRIRNEKSLNALIILVLKYLWSWCWWTMHLSQDCKMYVGIFLSLCMGADVHLEVDHTIWVLIISGLRILTRLLMRKSSAVRLEFGRQSSTVVTFSASVMNSH